MVKQQRPNCTSLQITVMSWPFSAVETSDSSNYNKLIRMVNGGRGRKARIQTHSKILGHLYRSFQDTAQVVGVITNPSVGKETGS